MNVYFNSCHEAIDCATQNKLFGLYYSESSTKGQSVHVHDCCEIFLSLSDGNSFLIDDKVYNVAPNELFIINQFEAHKVASSCSPFIRYSLHVHPSFIYSVSTGETDLGACFYTNGKVDKIKLTDEQVKRFVALFNDLKDSDSFGNDTYKRLRVTEILLEVCRLTACTRANEVENQGNRALQLAVSYINENFSAQLTLENIAKHAFVSVNQLCALFKKHLSTTAMKYVNGKRISEAKRLLSEGKSVTEAAFSSGFNDYANFIRCFKSAVGVSPGKFKAEKSNQKEK